MNDFITISDKLHLRAILPMMINTEYSYYLMILRGHHKAKKMLSWKLQVNIFFRLTFFIIEVRSLLWEYVTYVSEIKYVIVADIRVLYMWTLWRVYWVESPHIYLNQLNTFQPDYMSYCTVFKLHTLYFVSWK